ncbi:hypothetical protein [Tautonia marina]|uniref:hypothetical protein n=1 Tax=Tautonia marina TaxID=2653855 RepID=UPI001260B81D|nr:hypothetical protein [Tautonia marina]
MSQARSSRGAKGGGRSRGSRSQAVATPRGGRGVYVQQARSDIFVVLLGVALGSLIIGCLFLALKLNQYEFSVGGPGGF